MRFNKGLLLLSVGVLLLMNNKTLAQNSFKQVDSISYALYTQKNWTELVRFGNQIKNEGFNFYLLNLRLGIANYNMSNYTRSIQFFKKALKNNSVSEVAKEYLYWNYLQLGKYDKARYYFNKLTPKTQDAIKKLKAKKIRYLDFIYTEGGINIQEQKNSGYGNISYFNIGLSHELTPGLSIYHAYNFQAQQLDFSEYKIHRYYVMPKYLTQNGFEYTVAVNYTTLKSNIDYVNQLTQTTIQNDTLLSDGFVYDRVSTINQTSKEIGTIKQNEIRVVGGVTKLFKTFKIGVSGGVSTKNIKTNIDTSISGVENIVLLYEGDEVFNEDYDYSEQGVIKKDSVSSKYIMGINAGIDLSKKLGLGIEVINTNFDSKNEIGYSLISTYKVSKNINLMANFVQKGKVEFFYANDAYLINNLDKTTRFSLVTDIRITKELLFYLIYQRDSIDSTLLNAINNSNTIITGLKFTL